MVGPVPVTGSQLLEYIHIAQLQVVVFVHMKMKPGKEAVLVKIIVDDLFPEIHEYFVR